MTAPETTTDSGGLATAVYWYLWDPPTRRWRDARTGRFVPPLAVRAALEGVIAATGADVARLTADLRAGRITLAAWQGGMAATLKAAHLAALLAAGGRPALTGPAALVFGALLDRQWMYLDRLAAQIASGAQPLSAALAVRAGLYAQAVRGTWEVVRRQDAAATGKREERNLRGALDSCAGCLDATGMGWVPLGTLSPPGSRDCLSRCHCSLEYR